MYSVDQIKSSAKLINEKNLEEALSMLDNLKKNMEELNYYEYLDVYLSYKGKKNKFKYIQCFLILNLVYQRVLKMRLII